MTDNTLLRATTQSELFLIPFWKGDYSKRNEFSPLGSQFFSFRVGPFFRTCCVYSESEQKVTNLSPLSKNGGKFAKCINFPLTIFTQFYYYKYHLIHSVRPAKIQISLDIRAVWSESSLGAYWIKGAISSRGQRLHGCAGLFESLGAHVRRYIF